MAEQVTSDDTLLPSESTVLEALASANAQWTQRELAHKTGYSIGLINIILKRLAATGYIKVVNINRQKFQYLLTPQGFAAASKTACQYVLQTIQNYQKLYFQISLFFKELQIQGHRDLFVECSDSKLFDLVQVVMRESAADTGIRFHEVPVGGVTKVRLNGAFISGHGPVLDFAIQSDDGGLL